MQCKRTMLAWLVANSVLIIAFTGAVHAAPIVWEFNGTITEIGSGSLRPDGITVGTPFSGSVTFNSTWPLVDRDPLTMGAVYGAGSDPYGIEVLVGGTLTSTLSSGLPVWYTVADDRVLPFDSVITDLLSISDRPPTSTSAQVATLVLRDDTGILLSSEDLVVLPPDPSMLSSATLTLLGLPPIPPVPMSEGALAVGTIEHLRLQEIPEPTTALLCAVGAVALVGARIVWKGRPTSR